MRRAMLFFGLLSIVTLMSLVSTSAVGVADTANKQHGVATFYQPTRLLDVTLKGQYLFVHDDAAMARGEACTYVYKDLNESKDKLVASFHCLSQSRNKATHFTVRTTNLPSGITEIREIQFAGTTNGHRVPETR